jgi:hypothetical protein
MFLNFFYSFSKFWIKDGTFLVGHHSLPYLDESIECFKLNISIGSNIFDDVGTTQNYL